MAGGIDGLGGLDQVVAAFRQAAGGRGAERSALAGVGAEQPPAVRAGDRVALSAEAQSLTYARAQFEFNVSAVRGVESAGGREVSGFSFSVKGSVEFLAKSSGVEAEQVEADAAAFAEDPFGFLKDFFSPDKTADRILDFALSGFEKSATFRELGDTDAGRAQFADLIGGAVKQAFAEARSILGELDEVTEAGLVATDERVRGGLEDFVATGARPDPGRVARVESFRAELSVEVQTRVQRRAAYDASGQALDQARAGTFAITG